ncbi:hypothetical protein OC844_007479, partial [Tilletia horrida]
LPFVKVKPLRTLPRLRMASERRRPFGAHRTSCGQREPWAFQHRSMVMLLAADTGSAAFLTPSIRSRTRRSARAHGSAGPRRQHRRHGPTVHSHRPAARSGQHGERQDQPTKSGAAARRRAPRGSAQIRHQQHQDAAQHGLKEARRCGSGSCGSGRSWPADHNRARAQAAAPTAIGGQQRLGDSRIARHKGWQATEERHKAPRSAITRDGKGTSVPAGQASLPGPGSFTALDFAGGIGDAGAALLRASRTRLDERRAAS